MMRSRRRVCPDAARPVRRGVFLRSCAYAGYENRSVRSDPSEAPFTRRLSPMATSSSALGTGSGRSRSASMSVKIAVFAPMAMASDSTMTAAKPTLERSERRGSRGGGVHAALDEAPDAHLEVKRQLGVHVAFDATRAEVEAEESPPNG